MCQFANTLNPSDAVEGGELAARLARGEDPLGDAFCRARPARLRRAAGATYTPPAIVAAMVGWAAARTAAAAPARIVDMGAGSGRFLLAAARAFPDATLVAAETDPDARAVLAANAAAAGVAGRLATHAGDYRTLDLPTIARPTLFLGNPPYVRHHLIAPAWKAWARETAAGFGLAASGLCGLHVHFLLKTACLARPGDLGCVITAAEWLDVGYGALVRRLVTGPLGGLAVHVLDRALRPFEDALASAAIVCFAPGTAAATLALHRVERLEALAPLDAPTPTVRVARSDAAAAPRWSDRLRHRPVGTAGSAPTVPLGDLVHIHRGQVTGANRIWIAGPDTPALPRRLLVPAVTAARELFAAGAALTDLAVLRRVIDLPLDLDALSAAERAAVDRFLAWARDRGADRGYIARHRRAWWAVGLAPPAPILCTYMARRPPAFVRNRAGARHLNIAHGLTPRRPLDPAGLDRLAAWLAAEVRLDAGRVYAGGLVKFEPGDLARLAVPADLVSDLPDPPATAEGPTPA